MRFSLLTGGGYERVAKKVVTGKALSERMRDRKDTLDITRPY